MTNHKCNQCEQEFEFLDDMEVCPHCDAAIDESPLRMATEMPEISASVDTARDGATVRSEDAISEGDVADVDDVAGESSKTALAADLGYVDSHEYTRTLETPEEALESAGKSSSIPLRSVGEGGTNGELRDYKIESEIGDGSFGTVYRAVQVPLDRYVAIKLLKPLPLPPSTESDQSKEARHSAESKVREEFLREAQFTGRLEHPNIVPIHDIGVVSSGKRTDRPFYVMKEIKGISWQEVFHEKTRDENLDIFNRVVDAIGFAHNNNILHNDLKPENVMLGEFGEVLVVDWGQAIDTTHPETFRPGGTPAYCSPEMATYWCDFGKDPQNVSHLRRQIGPRSDVYLLGAILFQVVSSRPPHFGRKGETSADVMARASRNEIRRYDDFAEDELMQIALRALRKSENEINTVGNLQSELKSYEEQKRSIDIRDRAFDLFDEAKVTSNYDMFQKAKFGFEESLELWADNPTALEGLHQTRLSCAELALDDQNFDLGLGMLDQTDSAEEVRVKTKLEVGKKQRDRRKRLVGILGMAFAAALGIGAIGVSYFYSSALEQQKIADEKTKIADGLEVEIEENRIELAGFDQKILKKELEFQKKEKNLVLGFQSREDEFKGKEDDFKTKEENFKTVETGYLTRQKELDNELESASRKVMEEQQKVAEAQENSKLLKYKTEITAIEQKAVSGDFHAAMGQLEMALPETKTSYEWRRLNLLSHPEVTDASRFPDEFLAGADLSGNRKWLAVCFSDRIEICKADKPTKIETTIKQSGVQSIALSHDGKNLAIAIPGEIRIVDTESGRQVAEPLVAQSVLITDLEFSRDGQCLLSVGKPSLTGKSSSGDLSERELMVWESEGNDWKKMANPRVGNEYHQPSEATFSANGRRIVTSSPNAEFGKRFARVFEFSGGGKSEKRTFYLVENSNTATGFNTSIFADESGDEIISSYSDSQSHQIVVWRVDNSVPVSFTNDELRQDDIDVDDSSFNPTQSIRTEAKVHHLDFDGQYLLAATDKRTTCFDLADNGLADLATATPKSYPGHGRPIDSVASLDSDSTFISIAHGAVPEILVTDRSIFQDETYEIRLGDDQLTDGSSPSSFFESTETGRVIVGNDHGLVAVNDANLTAGAPSLKWKTSAWGEHIVTRDHLFAVSARDYVYRYDLVTGELESILTGLSEFVGVSEQDVDAANKISSIEISNNSQFAVVQRNNEKKQFEIWNLQNQTSRIVKFDQLEGLRDLDQLPQLTVSPDGRWIAGGKVRFYVWGNDGTVVGNAGIETFKKPLSSLRFFAGESKLAVGYGGVLKIYDVGKNLRTPVTYNISNFPDPIGRPNVVDAAVIDDLSYVVIRRIKKNDQDRSEPVVELIRMDEGKSFDSLATFPLAQHASISDGELLVTTPDTKLPITRFDIRTKKRETQSVSVSSVSIAGQIRSKNIFSRVYKTTTDELVLNWQVAGKHNSVTINEDNQLSELSVIATPTIEAVAVSQDKAMTYENGKIRLWELSSEGKPTVSAGNSMPGHFRIASFSPDADKAFVVSTDQKQAGVVDLSSGEMVDELAGLDIDTITAANWSLTGDRLVLGFSDGKITIKNLVENSSESVDAPLATGAVEQVKFSGDGLSIVAIQNDTATDAAKIAFVVRKRKLGDEPAAADTKWISVRLSHTDNDSIHAADISFDGNRVVTGSGRGRITLWVSESNVGTAIDSNRTDRELLTVSRLSSPIRDIAFIGKDSAVLTLESAAKKSNAIVFPTVD